MKRDEKIALIKCLMWCLFGVLTYTFTKLTWDSTYQTPSGKCATVLIILGCCCYLAISLMDWHKIRKKYELEQERQNQRNKKR